MDARARGAYKKLQENHSRHIGNTFTPSTTDLGSVLSTTAGAFVPKKLNVPWADKVLP
jgi:hypothetical protein